MADEPTLLDDDAEQGASAAAEARASASTGWRSRVGSRFGDGDPVLRILVTATFVGTLGRGVFITVTVLYLTFVVGLRTGEVAVVSGVGAAVGIGTSFLGGWLADRFSARRVLVITLIIESAGLIAYAFVGSFWIAVLVGCLTVGAEGSAHSTRAAIIGRAFEGPKRVNARAVLRTVTNLGIAIGAGLGGIALLVDTPVAYRVTLVAAGLVYLSSSFLMVRLPASVDATARHAQSAEEQALDPRAHRRAHSPWRDRRYLLFAALASLFGLQFAVFEFGVPLWIAHETTAPRALVSVLLIINTLFVIALQVPLSRGTEDLRRAARVFAIAGVVMAAACFVYGLSAGIPPVFAVGLLVVAAVAHSLAEVLSQAAGWGLAFELADPVSMGAYQGITGMGYSAVSTVGPLLVTVTALNLGLVGWGIMAALFAATALGVTVIARRAARESPALAAG